MPVDGKIRMSIEYCVECNYWPRTAWMIEELLNVYNEDISELAVIPGHKGAFKITIDDDVVFDKKEAGRFPEPSEIFEKILEVLD